MDSHEFLWSSFGLVWTALWGLSPSHAPPFLISMTLSTEGWTSKAFTDHTETPYTNLEGYCLRKTASNIIFKYVWKRVFCGLTRWLHVTFQDLLCLCIACGCVSNSIPVLLLITFCALSLIEEELVCSWYWFAVCFRISSLHACPPSMCSVGFEKPSAIQQRSIRPITSGRDVIAQWVFNMFSASIVNKLSRGYPCCRKKKHRER